MLTSERGIACIKAHESLRLVAYPDTGGVWTIGYGHTRGVKQGDTCTEEQALQWLHEDLSSAEQTVDEMVQVPLNQNEYDALVSFVFNIGRSQFYTSTLLRKLNCEDYDGAADQFPRWKYDGGRVVNGLIARRADERALFLS